METVKQPQVAEADAAPQADVVEGFGVVDPKGQLRKDGLASSSDGAIETFCALHNLNFHRFQDLKFSVHPVTIIVGERVWPK